MKTTEKYLSLITKPGRFFATALLEQKVGWALFFLFFVSCIFNIARAGLDGSLGLPSTAQSVTQFILTGTLGASLYCVLYACFTTVLGKKMGGKGTFKRLFIVGAYSMLPVVLFAAPPTALMGLIWSFCLAVIGLRIAHGFPLGRAITVQAAIVALTALFAGVMTYCVINTQRHYPAEKLLHQAAPAVTLQPFDGEPFTLSSLQSKSVVVLDFWATWCSPCRASLPVLAKVASEYKDKGVVFFAVSNDDDWHTAKQYLEEHKIELTGVKGSLQLDHEFLVEPIPQTVIIDKNGTVVYAHVGVPRNQEDVLKAELDKCLGVSR